MKWLKNLILQIACLVNVFIFICEIDDIIIRSTLNVKWRYFEQSIIYDAVKKSYKKENVNRIFLMLDLIFLLKFQILKDKI